MNKKYQILLLVSALAVLTSWKISKCNTSDTYQLVADWPNLANKFPSGQVSGIGVDNDQNVFFVQRSGRNWTDTFPDSLISQHTIFKLDSKTGSILSSWGSNIFIMPHGLSIDDEDNVWVTDVGLQQVFKFSQSGKLLMTVGTAKTPGNDATHFNLPTDVAVSSDGSFYVSDGYENSRVVKFSSAGKYLFEWGVKGVAPGQFNIPHSIALDKSGNVYVADRENNRIQKFDNKGHFVSQWKNNEANKLYAVAINRKSKVLAVDDLYVNDSLPFGDGVIILDPQMNSALRFGRERLKLDKYFYFHDLAVDKNDNIYVANIGKGSRVLKFAKTAK